MLVHRLLNSINFGWIFFVPRCFWLQALRRRANSPSVVPGYCRQTAEERPIWSFDLDSDYTFGSSIQKYSNFGPQAGYSLRD